MKKIMMTLAAVLCCAMTMTVFTSCSKDNDNPEPEPEPAPIEYGKVFTYTYEGQTLYYVIDETSQTATAVAPCYPDYPNPKEKAFGRATKCRKAK